MSFVGCIKNNFKDYSTVGKEHQVYGTTTHSYPNCTMPWHQSMLEDQLYNETEMEPCNSNDAYTLYLLNYEFAQKGANMNNSACMGKNAFTTVIK